MMKRELRDKWVAALRSGEYTKTTGTLKAMRAGMLCHCNLGVLAEVGGLKFSGPNDFGSFDLLDETGNLAIGYSPFNALFDFDELEEEDENNFIDKSYTVNDIGGKSFAEIADWVETNIPVED